MKCTYYPGCSLHATGRAYDESTRAVAPALGIELVELPDWNCCGATAYMGVNELLAHSLTARNLSLAKTAGLPVVAPCSACYTNLKKTEKYLAEYPDLKAKVDQALAAGNLKYDGGVTTRHLLEAVVEDVGLDKVKAQVKKPLTGLKVAPYYGCQIVRPYGIHDDEHNPMMLDRLLTALGATVVPYALKTMCCGGALMGTKEEVALVLCKNLLTCAKEAGADCIAVTCPLCQMNVDMYQRRVNSAHGTDFALPVLYFTQLMGAAFGLAGKELGFGRIVQKPPAQLEARN